MKQRYRVVNLRFKENEWIEFEKLVEIYRERVSARMSVHLVAKALLEHGSRSVMSDGVGI